MDISNSNLGSGCIKPQDAARILQSGEYSRRRGYLSKTITTWNQIAVSGTIAIWAFLIPWQVIVGENPDHILFTNQVALASALSAVLLGLWRFYVHYLDKSIIRLYPIMYLCERILSPVEACTLPTPKSKLVLLNKTTALSPLRWVDIQNSDFRERGHTVIDLFAAAFIFAFGLISVWTALHYKTASFVLFGKPNLIGYMLLFNITGLILVLMGWIRWRRCNLKWPVPDDPQVSEEATVINDNFIFPAREL